MAGIKHFRRLWYTSPVLTLVLVNCAVFLVVSATYYIADVSLTPWIGMIAPIGAWINRPWGAMTYMFVQTDFLHLLFNMLWLWAFGNILVREKNTRALLMTYIASGVGGAIAFEIAATVGAPDHLNLLIGSSASVLGIIAATAAAAPRMRLNLVLFGEVELRWVALGAIVICVFAPGWSNLPTLAAHVGGVVAGYIAGRNQFISALSWPSTVRRGRSQASKWRPTQVRQHERRGLSVSEQAEFDALLDRVRKSGYKNLSTKEQRRLFELSNHIK